VGFIALNRLHFSTNDEWQLWRIACISVAVILIGAVLNNALAAKYISFLLTCKAYNRWSGPGAICMDLAGFYRDYLSIEICKTVT